MKRIMALSLVLLLSIENFAAVVSDNDGSAFITKAEFDSLKNDFQSQIDQYNSSIDNKIDGAIASYLAGINLTKAESKKTLFPGEYESVCYNDALYNRVWRYKYGSPYVYIKASLFGEGHTIPGQEGKDWLVGYFYELGFPDDSSNPNAYKQHKLLLSTVNDNKGTAEWGGFSFGSKDYIKCLAPAWTATNWYVGYDKFYWSPWQPSYNDPIRTEDFWNTKWEVIGINNDGSTSSVLNSHAWMTTSVTQDWGNCIKNNIILLKDSKKYLNFVRYPMQRNLKFHTSETDNSTFEKLWTTGITRGATLPVEVYNSYAHTSTAAVSKVGSGTVWGTTNSKWYMMSKFANRDGNENVYGNTAYSSRNGYMNWPCIGFEDDKITNWNQIYTSKFDSIMLDDDLTDKSKFLQDEGNKYHVGIVNGIPIIKIEHNEVELTYDINLIENTYDINTGAKSVTIPTNDCYIWFSDEPYDSWPNNNNCLEFEPLGGTCEKVTSSSEYSQAVKIPAGRGGTAKVKLKAGNKGRYIWIKWTTNYEDGGGTLVVPSSIIYEAKEN